MLNKEDIVEVNKIDDGKRITFTKYLGRRFKIKDIGSTVWRHNIQLEQINEGNSIESFMDKVFLERHGWNEIELTKLI